MIQFINYVAFLIFIPFFYIVWFPFILPYFSIIILVPLFLFIYHNGKYGIYLKYLVPSASCEESPSSAIVKELLSQPSSSLEDFILKVGVASFFFGTASLWAAWVNGYFNNSQPPSDNDCNQPEVNISSSSQGSPDVTLSGTDLAVSSVQNDEVSLQGYRSVGEMLVRGGSSSNTSTVINPDPVPSLSDVSDLISEGQNRVVSRGWWERHSFDYLPQELESSITYVLDKGGKILIGQPTEFFTEGYQALISVLINGQDKIYWLSVICLHPETGRLLKRSEPVHIHEILVYETPEALNLSQQEAQILESYEVIRASLWHRYTNDLVINWADYNSDVWDFLIARALFSGVVEWISST